MRIFSKIGSYRRTRTDLRRRQKRKQSLLRQTKLLDQEARETVLQVYDYTQVSVDRLVSVIDAVRYVHRYMIPGAVVECGVWRGGVIMAAAITFRQLGAIDRIFYLYDTFTGMPQPGGNDIFLTRQIDARDLFRRRQTAQDSSDWNRAALEEVKENLAKTRYDMDRFVAVPGKVEDTIPAVVPDEIAILRLDTDFYDSTRHELEYLFPRLVRHGVLIVDDYYSWSGSREATDEFFAKEENSIFLVKVGNSVVGVKT